MYKNKKIFIFFIVFVGFFAFSAYSQFEDSNSNNGIGRYKVKNLRVKSYYMNQQGELIRWSDDEILKIDTLTGRVWKWVSERGADKKSLQEYWQEIEDNTQPMADGAR